MQIVRAPKPNIERVGRTALLGGILTPIECGADVLWCRLSLNGSRRKEHTWHEGKGHDNRDDESQAAHDNCQ